MKKAFALTLCLLLFASTALAGTMPLEVREINDTQTLVVALPEGVTSAEISEVYDLGIVEFELEDTTMPNYLMVIAYSDVLHEKDITDLTDDEIAMLVAYTAADSETHSYEVIEMADGWPGVLVKYDESESDWVDAFTVISGYLIQIHGWHDDFALLTDAENDFAFVLLDSIDIVDMTE